MSQQVRTPPYSDFATTLLTRNAPHGCPYRTDHQGNAELPRHQRLTPVRLLLDLDQPGTSAEADAAWDEEIRARVKAVDDGRAVGIPYEQIRKEMAKRFPSQ